MAVRRRLLASPIGQGKSVKHFVFEQQVLALSAFLEHGGPCSYHSTLEGLTMPANHELVQVGHRLGVLTDLLFCGWIEDGEAGVDVPFVGVDPECYVHFDVFDASDPASDLPWKLVVRAPCRSHTQESSVGDGLRICGDVVVHLAGEINVAGSEGR